MGCSASASAPARVGEKCTSLDTSLKRAAFKERIKAHERIPKGSSGDAVIKFQVPADDTHRMKRTDPSHIPGMEKELLRSATTRAPLTPIGRSKTTGVLKTERSKAGSWFAGQPGRIKGRRLSVSAPVSPKSTASRDHHLPARPTKSVGLDETDLTITDLDEAEWARKGRGDVREDLSQSQSKLTAIPNSEHEFSRPEKKRTGYRNANRLVKKHEKLEL